MGRGSSGSVKRASISPPRGLPLTLGPKRADRPASLFSAACSPSGGGGGGGCGGGGCRFQ